MPKAVPPPIRAPRLLVELPSWRKVFFGNLRDLLRPPKLPPLRLTSAPAPFWTDVFVQRPMPWRRFTQSIVFHVIALALLVPLASWVGTHAPILPPTTFDRNQVITYQPTEYLPPLNTLRADSGKSHQADPVASQQPIISVPAEADNSRQTIVTAPNINVKLKRDVALPNIVAWREKPAMPIAPAPLIPAASLNRLNPNLENSVVAPPPDAKLIERQRDSPRMQTSVVAPPPDLSAASSKIFQTQQAAVIEPPPNVQAISSRQGDINIARSAVVAPAPQLALADQRASRRSSSSLQSGVPQVISPPPSLRADSSTGAGGANRGTQMVALSLHPAVGAPSEPPPGNRRGRFAASSEGKAGASGTPGSPSANNGAGSGDHGKGAGNGQSPSNNNLPAGLYVGNPAKPATSAIAGNASGNSQARNSVNPNLLANARPPRVAVQQQHPLQPGNESKLSDAERQVFGDRKFYSLTLNMPNLNSAGGSWVIRFAELQKNEVQKNENSQAAPASLSAPAATRKVDPAYPMQLMRENVAGTVILYAVIHADGSVGSVRVLRSVDDRIDQFATQAVAQWQFAPATKNGAPIDVEATFQIPFRPARGF